MAEKYAGTKKFYVFYDSFDFVKFFGTAEELVKKGYFKSAKNVRERASKIKNGAIRGAVVILPLVEKGRAK